MHDSCFTFSCKTISHPTHEHLQPVVAQDRIQGLFSFFQFFPSDHKNGVFCLSQAKEAARRWQGWHPQPVCIQMVVLKGNTWSLVCAHPARLLSKNQGPENHRTTE